VGFYKGKNVDVLNSKNLDHEFLVFPHV